MEPAEFINELTYQNYAHNRRLSPHVSPERWSAIYANVPAMEARFQEEGHVEPQAG